MKISIMLLMVILITGCSTKTATTTVYTTDENTVNANLVKENKRLKRTLDPMFKSNSEDSASDDGLYRKALENEIGN